jgi:hypothetical protein
MTERQGPGPELHALLVVLFARPVETLVVVAVAALRRECRLADALVGRMTGLHLTALLLGHGGLAKSDADRLEVYLTEWSGVNLRQRVHGISPLDLLPSKTARELGFVPPLPASQSSQDAKVKDEVPPVTETSTEDGVRIHMKEAGLALAVDVGAVASVGAGGDEDDGESWRAVDKDTKSPTAIATAITTAPAGKGARKTKMLDSPSQSYSALPGKPGKVDKGKGKSGYTILGFVIDRNLLIAAFTVLLLGAVTAGTNTGTCTLILTLTLTYAIMIVRLGINSGIAGIEISLNAI